MRGRRAAAREVALTQGRPEQLILLSPRGHQPSFQPFVSARKGASVVPEDEQRGGQGLSVGMAQRGSEVCQGRSGEDTHSPLDVEVDLLG